MVRPAASFIATVVTVALASCGATARPISGPIAAELAAGIARGTAAFDHSTWDRLLRRHVTAEGRVDYLALRSVRGELDGYLKALGAADLRALGRDELEALFINAYNACTVRTVLDGIRSGVLPDSIRGLRDPWGRRTCVVAGHALSLDDIEHRILRPLFRDARVHAAVNCAARSCPALAPFAFRGDRIEEQLDARLRAMLAEPGNARVEGGRLRLSRIFDWYRKDFVASGFTGSAPSLVALVRRLGPPQLRAAIDTLGPQPKIGFLPYDWGLNAP